MTVITEPRNMTISNIFIVPIFKIDRNSMIANGFINSYLYNTEKNFDYEDFHIHMVYHPSDMDMFNKFVEIEKIRLGKLFVDEYDYEDGYSVLVYKVPEDLNYGVNLILEGKYSKLDKHYMNHLPNIITVRKRTGVTSTETSLSHLIYTKDPLLRKMWESILNTGLPEDSEVWERRTKDEETLYIDRIKNQISPIKLLN